MQATRSRVIRSAENCKEGREKAGKVSDYRSNAISGSYVGECDKKGRLLLSKDRRGEE
jgi:hypothetical protein